MEFLDRFITDGKTYYYRVAAVDQAGNLGVLSPEKEIKTPRAEEESTKVFVPQVNRTITLPKSGLAKVEGLIRSVDQTLLDTEAAQDTFDQKPSDLQSSAERMDIFSTLESSLLTLREMRGSLDALKFVDPASIGSELAKKELELKKLRLLTPQDMQLVKRSELQEILTTAMMETARSFVEHRFSLSADQSAAFLTLISQEARSYTVNKTISELQVSYLDGDPKEFITVEKNIGGPEDVSLMAELFPSDLALAGPHIQLEGKDYAVSADTPYVLLGSYTSHVAYHFESADFEDAKKAVTLLLSEDVMDRMGLSGKEALSPGADRAGGTDAAGRSGTHASAEDSLGGVTGKSVLKTRTSPLSIFFVVLGVLIILGLVSYYVWLRLTRTGAHPNVDDELRKELDELQDLTGKSPGPSGALSGTDSSGGVLPAAPGETKSVNKAEARIPAVEAAATTRSASSRRLFPAEELEAKEQLDQLLKKAYQALREGRPEHARAIYVRIQVIYRTLSSGTRHSYEDRILQLHSSVNISSVRRLFEKGYGFLDQGDARSAAMVYGEIKEIYSKLPKEFQKKMFAPSMRFYHRLSWKQLFGKDEKAGSHG
ncbi:MAG: hypothetical protein GXP63_01805 [DPANN group archaeon]|nr:hypothetical protein [DPANN group archaeon]